jgi:hypothetical protein
MILADNMIPQVLTYLSTRTDELFNLLAFRVSSANFF